MTVLELKNLDKSYGPVHAVNQLDLKVKKGQVYGILGPNGSGKTTTLAMAMGIVHPDKGSCKWFDQQAGPSSNRRIGTLIESPNFYPYLNLVDNLKIVCQIKGVDNSDIDRVLEIVGLFQRRKSKFYAMSYGMKQRLVLGTVLLGDPDVLVLDEPANGLDPEGIAEVRKLILEQAALGKTILLASHILDEVEKVCTHVAILKGGHLLAAGEVGKLLKAEEFLILESDEMEVLKEYLKNAQGVASYERLGNAFKVLLKDNVKPETITRGLMENKILLRKVEIRKQSLEEQFLELVKQ